jgi:lysophospholipase L1-like esterase
MHTKTLVFAGLFLVEVTLGAATAFAQPKPAGQVWVASWGASQQIPETRNELPPDDLRDATVRQIVRLSVGGSALRVHITNTFGTEPLRFTAIHVARPVSIAGSAIDSATDKALTFSGSTAVTVPAGAEVISDPVEDTVAPLTSWAITYHLMEPPTPETSHPGSRATTYYMHGDFVGAADLAGAKTVEHWYQLSGIDVLAPADAAALVVLGDSITDGHATTTNGNNRWTDVLAERLQASAAGKNIAVINVGTGGNHLLTDGLGPNALARFDRDVLARAGVRWLMVLEGVNDLGGLAHANEAAPAADHAALVSRMLMAYAQVIERAHAHGIEAIGATLTPYGGSMYAHAPGFDQDRQAINAWIRAPGHFDAVVDFDKAIADPAEPNRMLPADDCGDHLHPNPAGYKAMGEAVPVILFTR